MSKNITNLISPWILYTSITNQAVSWFDPFTASYYLLAEMSRNSYLREFCAQVSQIVFQADLTVLSLIRTVCSKMSQNSYLREFCAQVSKIVFLADLTVLRLITTVWTKMSQNSYLREVLCTSITNRVLWGFDCFSAFCNCNREFITKLISPRVLCTSVTSLVLSWFDRFTAFYNCMSKNVKNSYHGEFCAQVSQIVFLADLTVLRPIRTVWARVS